MPLIAVALLSGAALAYEVLLTRIFSIVQWHHFAYMMISVALLGYGASGTFLSLAQRALKARFAAVFSINAALFGISSLLGVIAAQQVGFNPLEIFWDPHQVLRLVAIYLLLFFPFFCAANAIGLTLTSFPQHIHRIYAYDLVGAGAGSLGIVLLLFALMPTHALQCLSALGLAAAALALWRSEPRGRRPLWLALAGLPWLLPESALTLQLSPYKGLSQALQVTGTRVTEQRSSPLGLIAALESPRIPLREAPGLSLNAPVEPPPQVGVFTDGDAMSVITRYDGRREPLSYLDFVSSALPYHLLHRPRVLVLGAGGGADVLQAVYHEARQIDAVELNPQVADLVRGRYGELSGHLYERPDVHLHIAEARGFVAASPERYDLIQVALLDSFGASSAGLYALSESYLYTVEALQAYLAHLTPGGLLSITRWVKLPPRDSLKLFATAVNALEHTGVAEPGQRLALIRSWKTATMLVKNGAFTPQEIAAIRDFCAARSFDLDYYPGIEPAEANRYNILDRPYFFEGARALLGDARQDFIERYKFYIAPATDDRPYFFHFFKWEVLPEIMALKGSGGMALLESGYLVLAATLVQALLASLVLVLLPLAAARRFGPSRTDSKPSRRQVLVYFTGLGLAFMFVEIAFIQKFILFLGHPVYSVTVVLAAFLVFAGLGSRFSARLTTGRAHQSIASRPVLTAVAAITFITIAYLLLLPSLFQHLITLPAAAKVLTSIALIAPLAFCMGVPFPLGLTALAASRPELLPWAWAVNGCASVVAAVLATLLAVHLGFTAVLGAALVLYVSAAFNAPGSDRGQESRQDPAAG